jgi:hypothetical protein
MLKAGVIGMMDFVVVGAVEAVGRRRRWRVGAGFPQLHSPGGGGMWKTKMGTVWETDCVLVSKTVGEHGSPRRRPPAEARTVA